MSAGSIVGLSAADGRSAVAAAAMSVNSTNADRLPQPLHVQRGRHLGHALGPAAGELCSCLARAVSLGRWAHACWYMQLPCACCSPCALHAWLALRPAPVVHCGTACGYHGPCAPVLLRSGRCSSSRCQTSSALPSRWGSGNQPVLVLVLCCPSRWVAELVPLSWRLPAVMRIPTREHVPLALWLLWQFWLNGWDKIAWTLLGRHAPMCRRRRWIWIHPCSTPPARRGSSSPASTMGSCSAAPCRCVLLSMRCGLLGQHSCSPASSNSLPVRHHPSAGRDRGVPGSYCRRPGARHAAQRLGAAPRHAVPWRQLGQVWAVEVQLEFGQRMRCPSGKEWGAHAWQGAQDTCFEMRTRSCTSPIVPTAVQLRPPPQSCPPSVTVQTTGRHSLEDLQLIAECIGGPGLAQVCRLLAQDHGGWSGES